MIAKLISLVAGPIVRALAGVIIEHIEKYLARRDIERLRNNKKTLHEIHSELAKGEFNDKKSSDLSSKLAGVISKL